MNKYLLTVLVFSASALFGYESSNYSDPIMFIFSSGLYSEDEYITADDTQHINFAELGMSIIPAGIKVSTLLADSSEEPSLWSIQWGGLGYMGVSTDTGNYGAFFLESDTIPAFDIYKYHGDTIRRYKVALGLDFKFPEDEFPTFGFALKQHIRYYEGTKGAYSTLRFYAAFSDFQEERKNNFIWAFGISWARNNSSMYEYEGVGFESSITVYVRFLFSYFSPGKDNLRGNYNYRMEN